MDLLDLASVLATTEDHPARQSRVLYLTDGADGLEPAGFADAVGDVVTVLDRLDTDGADGLAVQVRVGDPGHAPDRPAAVVATRDGRYAFAVAGGHGRPEAALARPPELGDESGLQLCWRFVVHALAALGRADAVPEPPDDPHPATYLMAAWLGTVLQAAKVDREVLDRVGGLPSEAGLVAALDLPAELDGWAAVEAVVAVHRPEVAQRLGRNGVAWEAHALIGDPGAHLAAVADAGRVELADAMFADLVDRGWGRPLDDGGA